MRLQTVVISFLLAGVGAGVASAIAPALAFAQDAMISDRVAEAMPTSYGEPRCKLKGSHHKVNAANNHIKTAIEAEKPEKRARELQKGEQGLVEAIQKDKNKQEKNSSVWYTLGQVYLYQGNVVGADSALRRAATISPDCAGTIDTLRFIAWAPLVNAGVEFSKAKNNDSALVLFRQAAAMHPSQPQALVGAGVTFAGMGQTDSAIAYLQRAAELAEKANLPQERNLATFNLAALYQQADRHREAAAALEKYLAWVPNDRDAKLLLATSYGASGQTAKAQALEEQLLAVGGTAGSDSAGAGGVPTADAMRIGASRYNAKNYAGAAEAFEKVVAAAPYNRDALSHLSNSYLAMKNYAKLVPTAERLVAIEPMNENALRMLSVGYRENNKLDEAMKFAEQSLGLRAHVVIENFSVKDDNATLTATATGRAAQDVNGKALPPAAAAVVFEFIDAQGNAVATQEAQIPALKAGETHKIEVRGQGKGIVGWRYKRK